MPGGLPPPVVVHAANENQYPTRGSTPRPSTPSPCESVACRQRVQSCKSDAHRRRVIDDTGHPARHPNQRRQSRHRLGATYNDLGATITAPLADLNLGIVTFVNGAAISPVQIDTSTAATDTIDYVVTDSAGLAATSTRTVIVQAAAAVSTPPTPPSAATSTLLMSEVPHFDFSESRSSASARQAKNS